MDGMRINRMGISRMGGIWISGMDGMGGIRASRMGGIWNGRMDGMSGIGEIRIGRMGGMGGISSTPSQKSHRQANTNHRKETMLTYS
jgi:hypothetical protein